MNTFTLNKSLPYHLKSKGKIRLSIYPTLEEPKVLVDEQDDIFEVSVENNDVNLINHHKMETLLTRTQKNKENGNRNPMSILTDLALDIFTLAKNKDEYSDAILNVKLYLNSSSTLRIDSEDLEIRLEGSSLDFLEIECANLHFTGEKYNNHKLYIDSSNLSADILFDDKNSTIEISGNNAKVNLFVNKSFNGMLKMEGNNIKSKDPQLCLERLRDKKVGILDIDVNNMKLNIQETE